MRLNQDVLSLGLEVFLIASFEDISVENELFLVEINEFK